MHENTLSFEVKSVSVDDPGTFFGALSTYGNTDLTGDVVQPGAFTKTLQESRGRVPLFVNHNKNAQVGILLLKDTPTALMAEGKLNLDHQLGKDAYTNLLFNTKHGVRTGLSIGFNTVKDKMEGSIRHLLELKLGEGSLTLWPANQEALVTAVKTEVAAAVDEQKKESAARLIGELRALLRRGISEMDQRKGSLGRK